MIFHKKIILGAILTFCPLFHSSCLAGDKFHIDYNISNNNIEIIKKVEDIIMEIIKKDGEIVPFINLQFNLGYEYKTISYTDAKDNFCKININYQDKEPLLLDNFNTDLEFIIAHEIGHCILGKKIFYDSKFNWIINEKNIDSLSNQIEKQTNLAINSLECKNCNFKIAPPIAVYHEMYADIYGLTWITSKYKNLQPVLTLSKKRIESFNKNPISSFYGSGFSMPILLEYIDTNNNISPNQKIEIIAQKGFVEYLKFMHDNYFINAYFKEK